jgi:putative membrane protein
MCALAQSAWNYADPLSLTNHTFQAAGGGNKWSINMTRELTAAALALSAAILLTTPTSAAQAPTTENFVKTVAISDMFEIQSGQLAAEKAQNDDVQSFGKQMTDDHTETSDDLKELIEDEEIKVELPSKLDDEHQAKLDKLKGLSGNQFDKEYVRMQIDAHQKAVALFESYAAAGENDDLKKWVGDTLPTLKEHLEEAQNLKTAVDQTAQAEDSKKSDDASARDDKTAAVTDEEAKKPARKSNIKYLTRQAPTDWTAEALIGRTVENSNGDNLGEINNVIINEKGNVVAAVIGVGGFLGIGEKNVAVPFDALDFRTLDPAERRADTRDEKAEQKRDAAEARFDSEHADMHIVLNTTKEDLEAAPEFVWLEEQGADRAQDERTVR